jgi:hypothetical protein
MKTIIKKLKALFDSLPLPADAFVSRLTSIHDKMLGNTAFPNPPVDLAAFMTAITTFAASVVVALDGSKQAIATMKKQREGLVKMAELLGHYVEATSNNDPVTFTSSGFAIRSTAKVPPQPLAQPTILRVDQGKMGELLVILVAVLKARLYEIHYAPASPGGAAPTTFASITNEALALTGMMRDGQISRGRACELARVGLRENARSLYGFH